MSEKREQEIAALKELASCEGWRILNDALRRDWQGEGFAGKVQAAVLSRLEPAATDTVRELVAKRLAVAAVMVWPDDMRKKLEAEAAAEVAGEAPVVRRA